MPDTAGTDMVLVPRDALKTIVEEVEWAGDHGGGSDDADCLVCKAIRVCSAAAAGLPTASDRPEVAHADPS